MKGNVTGIPKKNENSAATVLEHPSKPKRTKRRATVMARTV